MYNSPRCDEEGSSRRRRCQTFAAPFRRIVGISPPPSTPGRFGDLAMISERKNSEIEELRAQLEEAEETLRAIRQGEVDALVVTERSTEKVYTLKSADRPYRLMIECMRQGAVTLTAGGQSLTIAGREASMLVELALAAGTIRPLAFGRVVLAFTPQKVELSITQTEQPVHLEG